jgi:hypothetical protein
MSEAQSEAMTAEEVLAGAATRLETHGWVQHDFIDATGRACLFGALHLADPSEEHWITVKDAVAQELGYLRPWGSETDLAIVDWNNTPGRSVDEVVTTLRNAKRWL